MLLFLHYIWVELYLDLARFNGQAALHRFKILLYLDTVKK